MLHLEHEIANSDPLSGPVHFSHLKYMGISPSHYRANILHPKAQTPAMRFGALVHALVLGGDVVVYDGERRGRDWAQFSAENDGSLIVTRSEHDRGVEAWDALRTHERAYELLQGDREHQIDWEIGDRACSSKLDVLSGDVVELKTATTTMPARFKRACLSMSYHAQLGFYWDAAASIGRTPRNAWIVGVETQRPYAVTVLHLTPRCIEAGRRLCRLWLEQLLGCERSDSWPSYTQSDVELDIEDDVEVVIDGEVFGL